MEITTNIQVQLIDQLFSYELKRSVRKSVRIQIHPNGMIQVIAPLELPLEEISKIVKQKGVWILRQLRFFEQFRPATSPSQHVSGETHRYLGRQYRLKIQVGEVKHIRLVGGFIEINIPENHPSKVESLLNQWYRGKAEIHFQRILIEVMPRFESYQLPTPEIKLRKMPTRWGSCSSKGTIYLNPQLIKASGSCIEYVIIHEICHLIHHNHNKLFYTLLERILPDWKQRKNYLERLMA